MSGVLFTGPRKGQTKSDHFIDTIFKACRGKGAEKGFAEMALYFNILSELDNKESKGSEYDENGSRLFTAVYNLPESVDKDLKLINYGACPFVLHSFPLMNSFAVLGKLDDSRAGFVLDYFKRDIKPTRTIAFAQERASQKRLEEAAENIFKINRANGSPAYSQKNTRKGMIDLREYGGEEDIAAYICEGELVFTGKLITQNKLVRAMMKNISKYEAFTPRTYVLTHYDFLTHFEEKDTKTAIRNKWKDLEKRVNRALKNKADAA